MFRFLIRLMLYMSVNTNGKHIDYYARNLATIDKLYNTVIWPNNLDFLARGYIATPPGIFNANVSGRVSPLGNFTGFADTAEYFFGLNDAPGETGPGILIPSYSTISNYTLYSFSSSCPQIATSIAYLSSHIIKPGSPQNGMFQSTLKQFAVWRFDEEGLVLYYDAWNENMAVWSEVVAATLPVETDPLGDLCVKIMTRCTENPQYESVDACAAFLETLPPGTLDEVWGNNIVCRGVHVSLTKLRPQVHCPHVGPTGGMKCVDVDYNTVYLTDDESLLGGLKTPFMCPDMD